MAVSKMRDSVERWLVHEGFSFTDKSTPEDSFRVAMRHGDAGLEIFEPGSQPNVLVLGTRHMLRNRQNIRYKNLARREREGFERRIAEYCRSIRAVHRILDENGRMGVGVYVVLDRQEQLNQADFAGAIAAVVEMGEKVADYVMRTF